MVADKERPLISVIVPIFNAEQYLKRCIDSVLSQDYENLEIVLVDDGSTDRSADICKNYETTDTRCNYIRQTNSGPDIARKVGFDRSAGDYIVFVDADDYILPGMLSTMYSYALKEVVPVVCCGAERFFDDGRLVDESLRADRVLRYDNVASKMQGFFEDRILQGSYWAKLIRRDVLSGYDFVVDSVIGEDISAALYILEQDQPIVMIQESFYRYYWNLRSISHSAYTDRHRVSLEHYLDICDRLANKHYISDSSVYGFFAERAMAVATAMSRGKFVNREVEKRLRDWLCGHCGDILKNKYTKVYMKCCIILYIVCPRFFILLYRAFFLLTGR